ncbi:hypothetical protein BKP42_63180 [Rhodococcus erythropolis]|nr:hypothetical protein BKP42_63180 [Rhodococcus erythropolis]
MPPLALHTVIAVLSLLRPRKLSVTVLHFVRGFGLSRTEARWTRICVADYDASPDFDRCIEAAFCQWSVCTYLVFRRRSRMTTRSVDHHNYRRNIPSPAVISADTHPSPWPQRLRGLVFS